MPAVKRTLAIETASEACSVALFEGTDLLASDHRVLGRGHAERLVPMIADLPDKGRADRIVVSLGPGSFTGVRIGIATARALGFAWGAQVLGFPTLALVRQCASEAAIHTAIHTATQPATESSGHPITVCMNGGHGEWFVQNFGADTLPQGAFRSLTPEAAMTAGPHRVIAGNRAAQLAELLGGDRLALDLLPDAKLAHLLRDTALTKNLAPIYGRAPDAVRQVKKPA